MSAVWNQLSEMHLQIFISENSRMDLLEAKKAGKNPVCEFDKILLGDWNDPASQEQEYSFNFTLSDSVRLRNASLFAHCFLKNKDETLSESQKMIYSTIRLVDFSKKRKPSGKRNLLNEYEAPQKEEFQEEGPVIAHWIGNLSITIVPDEIKTPLSSMPPVLRSRLLVDDQMKHFPIFYPNLFWNLKKEYIPIESSLDQIPMKISFNQMAFWKFQFLVQFEQSLQSQDALGNNPDEFKEMLRDANPYLLAITFVVSILHSIFDFLAFKNDIQFWKDREDFDGLSVRSILLNIFFQSVVLLYLIDNETSYMIIVSSAIGLLIEIWKARKAMNFKIDWGKFPFLFIEDKSSKQSKTKEYDEQALKYLSYITYPLLFGYAIYSVYYNEHKSWYSFVLGTLVGFVYAFGFIMMTPQLFINYKLKSVAHMPWKTFMYKALNTFIDDLFAFAIKMPTLHRLACLRDDVIFLIYLYQRWIYPVDKTRANEFGQKEDSDEGKEKTD